MEWVMFLFGIIVLLLAISLIQHAYKKKHSKDQDKKEDK